MTVQPRTPEMVYQLELELRINALETLRSIMDNAHDYEAAQAAKFVLDATSNKSV